MTLFFKWLDAERGKAISYHWSNVEEKEHFVVQHSLKIRYQAAKKKVFNASLTELTLSYLEHDSLLKLLAVGGQLAHRNVSVMPPVGCSIWKRASGRDTLKPWACMKVEAKYARGGLQVDVSELHFNLKRAYQTRDVGQPMTQGGKYPRLKSNRAYWRCFELSLLHQGCFF